MIYCFVEVYVLWDNDTCEAKVDQEIHKVTRLFCFLLLASCQTDNPVSDVGSLSEHFDIYIDKIKDKYSILWSCKMLSKTNNKQNIEMNKTEE